MAGSWGYRTVGFNFVAVPADGKKKEDKMPLPNLPTDNLYKFLALAGLTLGLFSFVFPKIQEHDVNRVLWETKIDIDVAGEQLSYIEQQISILDVKREEVYRKNANLKPIKDDEMRILDLQHNLRIQQAQARNKTKLLVDLTRELEDIRFFSKMGIVFGLVLACCGFSLWYVKLQRHQDDFWRNRKKEP
jgi:hypothetical protein